MDFLLWWEPKGQIYWDVQVPKKQLDNEIFQRCLGTKDWADKGAFHKLLLR